MEASKNAEINPSKALVKICRGITYVVSRLFWRIEYIGKPNIPINDGRGLIIVSNHPTYFDPFWIGTPINTTIHFLAWDKAFDWPLIGLLLRYLGAIPLSLQKGGTISTLKQSVVLLNNCGVMVIFPEGEREFADGKLLPFRNGALQLAMKTNARILPVTIKGGNKVWPRGKKLPGFGKVTVYYHDVISIQELEKGHSKQRHLEIETKRLRAIIEAPLKQ